MRGRVLCREQVCRVWVWVGCAVRMGSDLGRPDDGVGAEDVEGRGGGVGVEGATGWKAGNG